MDLGRHRFLKSPWLELNIMLVVLALSYIAMGLIARGVETPADGMSAFAILGLLIGFFIISFAIAFVAVLAGIGGGLIFTPIMLAFTSVDTCEIVPWNYRFPACGLLYPRRGENGVAGDKTGGPFYTMAQTYSALL
jgi:hypothetical protein